MPLYLPLAMPWASAISSGSLYVLLACHTVLPRSDHSPSGATPPSSASDTLMRAPRSAAILSRSAASLRSAAVRFGGLGLGVGLGSALGLGLGVIAATGVDVGSAVLPVRTSGRVSGITTTTKSTIRTSTEPAVSETPSSFSTRSRRGAAMKSYAMRS